MSERFRFADNKIFGYRDLTPDEIATMNRVKGMGTYIEHQIEEVRGEASDNGFDLDERWVSIAVTHLQQGLMALGRAVAKPRGF